MANTKIITLDWNTTALTVYTIVVRSSDSNRMASADGTFSIAAPTTAGAYNTLAEDGGIKGRYALSEARTVWTDGRYTFAIYKQNGGSPAPVSDVIIGTGEMDIVSDLEIYPDGSVAAIKTKTDFLPSATAGSAGGVFIAGTNAATTINTALTANITGNVTGNLSGSVGSVTGAVGSVTGSVNSVTTGVTVTTNNDKTGYALSAASVQAVWDALTSAFVTTGSIGKKLANWVLGTDSKVLLSSDAQTSVVIPTVTTVTTVTNDVGITQTAADKVWNSAARTLTSFGTLIVDIWAYSTRTLTAFSTTLAQSVWDVLDSAIVVASSIGIRNKTNIDATVSTRATQTSVNSIPTNPLLTTDSRLNDLDASISSRLATAGYTAPDNANIGVIAGKLPTGYIMGSAVVTSKDGTIDTILTDVVAIKAKTDLLPAGTGANQVILQVYLTATTTPVADVTVKILNSTQTLVIASGTTDVLGQFTTGLDNGTYKIRYRKAGYNFTFPETLVVTTNMTQINYATGGDIVITPPSTVNTCRVYEWCFAADDTVALATVTPQAKIVALPYDFNGKLHTGSVIPYSYNPATGLLYWDIVYGAQVAFTITELGVIETKTIPSVTTRRLSSITYP